MKAGAESGVEKCKMEERRRDGAAVEWPHQGEEKPVKEGGRGANRQPGFYRWTGDR